MKPFFLTASEKTILWKVSLVGLLFAILTAAFYFSPILTGDDWETFHGASWRILSGQPLYGEKITFAYYSNPPWVSLALIPVSVLPLRLGWAVICTANLAALVLVGWRWKLGLLKIILGLASPPMLYILLHGQIDMLILSLVCLPAALWPLAALGKPQVAIGLLAGIPPASWLKSALITGAIILVSLVLFGNWPMALVQQPQPFVSAAHNVWFNLWPFQVPAGLALILMGFSRRDEKFLAAGSPLMLPYAATSSLIGPWLAASTFLKDWQLLVVWLSWWGATLYRAV